MTTILAPIDFSPATQPVVAEAIKLARGLAARLEVLYVLPPPTTGMGLEVIPADPTALADQAAKDADEKLAALVHTHRREYPSLRALRLSGNAVEQIAAHARTLGADYIVVGSHGHGAVYDLLVGSTTRALIKRAPCPLVIVSPSAPDKTSPRQA